MSALKDVELAQQIVLVQEALAALHKEVADHRLRSKALEDARRKYAVPNYVVGDFVLVARPVSLRLSKLEVMWRGPFQVVAAVGTNVYQVQHIHTKVESTVHAARMQWFSDASLDVSQDLIDQVLFHDAHVYSGVWGLGLVYSLNG